MNPYLRSLVISILLACPACALSQSNRTYQEGVLVRFANVRTGTSCQTTGSAQSEAGGEDTIETRGTAFAGCSDVFFRRYTVRVGENTYVLERSFSKKSRGVGLATLGWSHAFEKDSVLANLLPGTPVQVRTDGEGFHIRVSQRESLFRVVAAE